MTKDTTPLEPDVVEHKFYATGVGPVLAISLSGGGGREELDQLRAGPDSLRPVAERTKEELDQEWGELVEEHRLAMPGVQVLFAFLLILPFQNRFEGLTTQQEYVYYAALLCATVAIILLITPTASHRIRWRKQDKEALMVMATRTAIAATVFIAAAMTASVYLITDVALRRAGDGDRGVARRRRVRRPSGTRSRSTGG